MVISTFAVGATFFDEISGCICLGSEIDKMHKNKMYYAKYWHICKIDKNIIFTYFFLQNNIWMWIGFKKVEGYLNFWSWSNCCLWNQFWKVFVVLKTQDAWPMSNMLSHIGHEDINLKNTILTYGKLNIWIGFK
jgi:hypothetical protein